MEGKKKDNVHCKNFHLCAREFIKRFLILRKRDDTIMKTLFSLKLYI